MGGSLHERSIHSPPGRDHQTIRPPWGTSGQLFCRLRLRSGSALPAPQAAERFLTLIVGRSHLDCRAAGDHPLFDRYWEVTGPRLLTSAFRDMVLAYYDTVRAMTGKVHIRYFAEKMHPDLLIRDGAITMFGAVKEIVLVRDPRDLVCSYRAFWGRQTAEAVSLIHSQLLELAERVCPAGPDTLLVRYEDLVLDPTETLGRICSFLGLEHGPAERRDDEAATFRKHGTSGSPQESIGRWRQELTAEEIAACDTTFGPLLSVFGCDL